MSTQKIGRYEIERTLGEGGMAVIYLARDPYTKRQVAVKMLLRPSLQDDRFYSTVFAPLATARKIESHHPHYR